MRTITSSGQNMESKNYCTTECCAELTRSIDEQTVPYDVLDRIDLFMESFIVKSNDKYWFMYAQQHTDDLVKHGYVTDRSNFKFGKSTKISPAMCSELAMWIFGHPAPCGKEEFLKLPSNGFRAPRAVMPTRELPLALLEETCVEAKRPDLEPTEAFCLRMEQLLQ